ncbi:MAG TPA: type II toxin-antitoxin system HicB family antitoxin [Ferrovibrio sp.]|uniref:type II toxin-antitoxin system HicB family antitoxin n=1 Tax=Ferrovibrio sp. TaxID=1917215 RepID=UPI002ECFCE49
MSYYVALIHKEKDSAYGVSFPDFPGCIGADDHSAEAAVRDAIEALAFHVEQMQADGEPVPPPRSLDELRRSRQFREEAEGAMIVYVPLLTPGGKIERINVSLDANTLRVIDEAAKRRGMTRSEFLATAARQTIEREAG